MKGKLLPLSAVALLSLLLSGCSGDAQAQAETFFKAVFDLKSKAFVDEALLQSWSGLLVSYAVPVFALIAVVGFGLTLVMARLRGVAPLAALRQGAWVWPVLLILQVSLLRAPPQLTQLGREIWEKIGLDLNLVRRALGIIVPWVEDGTVNVDLPGLVSAAALTAVFLSWHLAYEIGLVFMVPFAAFLSLVYGRLRIMGAWALAAVCWLAVGPLWKYGLEWLAGPATTEVSFGDPSLAYNFVLILIMAFLTALPLLTWFAVLWPWTGETEKPREAGQKASLADIAQTAAIVWGILREERRQTEAAAEADDHPDEGIIYGYPPGGSDWRQQGQIPSPAPQLPPGPSVPPPPADDVGAQPAADPPGTAPATIPPPAPEG